MLIAVLFVWNDFFPSWVNRTILATVILFPPMAYLTVLVRPDVRHAWRDVLLDSGALIVSAVVAFFRLFRPATVVKLARFVLLLKPAPTTVDEWITCCLVPFKTCVVVTFPMIWIIEKIISWFHDSRPYALEDGRGILESYLISLIALLFGALLQALFCRSGRATTTLRFFLWGILFPIFYIFMVHSHL